MPDTTGNPNGETGPNLPDVSAENPTATPAEPAFEVPAKYAGKSIEDVIKMHVEAEKAMGRQGNELGELRRFADSLVQRDLSQASEPKKDQSAAAPAVEWNDEDPTGSVQAMIKAALSDELAGVKQSLGTLGAQTTEARLVEAHGKSVAKTWQSQGFVDWVSASKVRQQLYATGNRGDFDSAHELLDTYKALNKTAAPSDDPEPATAEDPTAAAKKVQLESASGRKASNAGKPTYRRADIMKMRQENPDEYRAHFAAIQQAYIEGRVV